MKECCLNCKYYWDKCCHNNDVFTNKKIYISEYQRLSEDGYIDEIMEETNFGKLEDFELALENTNLSKKKIKELLEVLYENIDNNKREFTYNIDRAIYGMTEPEQNEDVEIFIKEPDIMKCHGYW